VAKSCPRPESALVHVEGIAECAPHAAKVDTGLAQVSGSRSRQALGDDLFRTANVRQPADILMQLTVVIGPLNSGSVTARVGFDSHRQIQDYVRALNQLYVSQPALYEVDFAWNGFQWIDFRDVDNSIVSFLRRARDPNDFLMV